MTELEGFEIFAPNKEKPLFICTGEKAVRICADAYKALGKPQYVNVFLDDVKKRILVKVSDKSFDNALKVVKHSGGRRWKMIKDLTGQRFGRLVVLKQDGFTEKNKHNSRYLSFSSFC